MNTLETFVVGVSSEPQPLLAQTTGKLLFEVRDRDETAWWLVAVDNGRIGIESVPGAVEADATIHTDRSLLEAVAQGRANAMSAMLRGELQVEGDAQLLVAFQRIFPGPNDSRQP